MDELTVNLLARVEQLEEAVQQALDLLTPGVGVPARRVLEQVLVTPPD